MAARLHTYCTLLTWTGAGAAVPFRNHRRDYRVEAGGKPAIEGSSDTVFRGDATRWSPEDLLVASLSACHQLWYLGLCAAAGIEVVGYQDAAEGSMTEEDAGATGQFTSVRLRPRVAVRSAADIAAATALHEVAHARCFIARSVNFPVTVEPAVTDQAR